MLDRFVWGEMANAQDYSDLYVARFTDEWQQIVARGYNHPSIIVWVPMREINGLMTYDRKPKAAPEEFEKIFGRR